MSSAWRVGVSTRSAGARRRAWSASCWPLIPGMTTSHGLQPVDQLPAREALVAARRLAHGVAVGLEDPDSLAADRVLVLDDEHAGVAGAACSGASGSSGVAGRPSAAAGSRHDGAAADLRGDLDGAAGVGHDAVDRGEAEAGALARSSA